MKKPATIHPGDWPERNGRARILVESPDHADLWAHAETLREAGYDVAVCIGPVRARVGERGPAMACPLLVDGRCSLTEGADVIVTSADLPDADELVQAHDEAGSVVVVEATLVAAAGFGTARILPLPVTEKTLVSAVTAALADR
ncbi:MAG: hypothetical protein ACXVRQ_12990 [Gaiellaceae bacterium]